MPIQPHARAEDLIVREVDDEIVVYDFKSHQATCLNGMARVIWRLCDGRRTIAELALAAGATLGAPVAVEVVWLALEQLSKHELLRAPVVGPRVDRRRRALVKKLAVTAGLSIALPAVWSILAPTPAYAASAVSCIPAGDCMGLNQPPGCCNNGSGMGFTCTGMGTCGGTNSTCNGQVVCR